MSANGFKSSRSEAVNIECRFAYPNVHEKRTKRANGQPLKSQRYDTVVLVKKLDNDPLKCANYAALSKLCMDAATKQPGWGGFPAGGHWPIQDGDAPPKAAAAPTVPGQAPAVPKEYPWRKGHWVVEATNYLDPGPRVCVMQNGQVVEIPARVINGQTMYKSGDYGYVSLHAYTFSNEKFGVNFGFEGVLFTREGEAIGSSGPRSAAQMFGAVAPVAPASVAPPQMPPMPGHNVAPPPTAPIEPTNHPFGPPPIPGSTAPALPPIPTR